jgi:alpha-tubulin suppressor-like RCC1 family protein
LKRDGTVESWGTGWNGFDFLTINPPADLSNVVAIAAGQSHGLALKVDGRVVAWGDNLHGETNVPVTLSNVIAIAANQYKSLALSADGTLTAWGQTDTPPNETNAVGIASGAFHDLALRGDGSMVGWGVDSYGVTDPPPGLTNVMAIAADAWNNVAITNPQVCFASRQTLHRAIYSGSEFTMKSASFPISRYQWQLNGTNISSASNSWLRLTNLTPTGAGAYRVIVSNVFGVALSSNIVLTVVTSPPIITAQSMDQALAPGSSTMLSVTAEGSLPITYQWRFNGTNIPGGTNNVLVFSPVELTDRGFYDVVASNSFGSTVSSNMLLHVLDLSEALNATNLVWTSGGDMSWFSQGVQTHGDLAAAQSGAIGDNQQSVLQTDFVGPGTLTFWWRTVSDPVNASLRCVVNGVEQGRISGVTDWQLQTFYLGSGVQALQWAYVKTNAIPYSLDAGWVDEINFKSGGTAPFITLNATNLVVIVGSNATLQAGASGTPPLSFQWLFNGANLSGATNASLNLPDAQLANEGDYVLVVSNAFGVKATTAAHLNAVDFAEALNAASLTWTTTGTKPWFAQTTTTHDGVAALRSGTIGGSEQSIVQTTVNGPGTLAFWWKVSSETNQDFMNFSTDGVDQGRISGNVNWQQKTYYLPPGAHTLTWSYAKNATVNAGLDAAWLDEVSFVEGGTAAYFVSGIGDQVVALTSNATFAVVAQGTPPLSYRWLLNGIEIPDATNATLTVTNVQRSDAGLYTVLVANSYGGSVGNANLRLLNVYAWGANGGPSINFGQNLIPTNSLAATAVAAGGLHSLALKPDGHVLAWGSNTYLQTIVPANLTNAMAIAAGFYHSLALRSNGTVTAWGQSFYNQTLPPASATNVTAIAAGSYHNVALRGNGSVVAWGAGTTRGFSPNLGQSIVPVGLTNVIAVAAGGYHSLALKRDGTVEAWGWNASGQTNVPPLLSDVVAIAAGGSNSLALKSDGTVVAWGDNTYGQTNIPPGLSNVVAVTAGVGHNVALRRDGSLVAWGLNANGQTSVPPGYTNVMAVSAGGFHNLSILNLGPVSFLNQPVSQTVFAGDTIRFDVAVLGDLPLSYQWQFNGSNLTNETNSLLVIADAKLSDSGDYSLIAGNAFGAQTTSVAVVTVNSTSPFFLSPLTNQTVVFNSNVTLAVSAGGLPPLTYQWRFGGTNLPDRTNATLVITNAQLTNEGFYSVVVSNAAGAAVGADAFLNVIDLAEALDATNLGWVTSTGSPWFPQTNITHDGIAAGSSGVIDYFHRSTLQATIAGPGTLTFWWRSSRATAAGFPGAYDFLIDATNQSRLAYAGAWLQATSYLASGSHVLQWKSSVSLGETMTNWLDQVSYSPGPTPALITLAPPSKTVAAGSDVTLGINAVGTPPLKYQWSFAGNIVSGATNPSLTLSNVQTGASGLYTVVVTNDFGSANTSATLTVTSSPPFILTQPANQEMVPANTVVFTVIARGSDPLAYQWQFNNDDIAGATGPSLKLSKVQTNNAGTYRVVVSNAYGTVISSNATLTIVPTVIVGWGSVFVSSPNPPPGLTNVAGIAAGDQFSAALKTDSTVFAWGWNAFGKLDVPAGLFNVVAISAGGDHGSTLLADRTVINWGDSFFDPAAAVPPGLSNVVDVAAGSRFNLALRRDGLIVPWGDNLLNPLDLPPGLSDVVDVAAGWYHGLALKRDGTVVAWGSNSSGQTNVPAGLSNVAAISAGWTHSLALRNDGTIVSWGDLSNLPSLSNVVAIASGAHHALALRSDGTVVAWGGNGSGQTNVPSQLANVVAIAAGTDHSLALLNDGSPYVVRHPWAQTILNGVDVEFTVLAMGRPPFSYQWKFNGTNIPAATNAVLKILHADVNVAGEYCCVVSNRIGAVTSLPAALTVIRLPRFIPSLSGFDSYGRFTLFLADLSGRGDILLYASTNLTDWQPILTNPPASGELLLVDPAATTLPQRFYRVQEQ